MEYISKTDPETRVNRFRIYVMEISKLKKL